MDKEKFFSIGTEIQIKSHTSRGDHDIFHVKVLTRVAIESIRMTKGTLDTQRALSYAALILHENK